MSQAGYRCVYIYRHAACCSRASAPRRLADERSSVGCSACTAGTVPTARAARTPHGSESHPSIRDPAWPRARPAAPRSSGAMRAYIAYGPAMPRRRRRLRYIYAYNCVPACTAHSAPRLHLRAAPWKRTHPPRAMTTMTPSSRLVACTLLSCLLASANSLPHATTRQGGFPHDSSTPAATRQLD
jgi:hypothetical protein